MKRNELPIQASNQNTSVILALTEKYALECVALSDKKMAWDKINGTLRHTFSSLNVFAAVKRTEMGKKTEESAGGTTNSIDPLPSFPIQN